MRGFSQSTVVVGLYHNEDWEIGGNSDGSEGGGKVLVGG
eukprot:CAMPEP_0118650688 /NCGR_PEP_ID=MMETSP0785-20121206/10379_1 /TAXON_ID=91992 /ORGANISM="Bolidomonas pacifica, Strain CCMP 1866" /LENGTH=38 /DNA_ID= /DNA_START= /DNA_END= /DNA_ORIENTATION=